MARRKFSLSVTAGVLLLVPVVVPAVFVLLISPSADQVGAQELRPKQANASGQRSAEAPLISRNQAATNPSAKPAGKMSIPSASPTLRDSSPRPSQSVANPVTRRAVPQPPKFAVSPDAAPEALQTQKSDTRSVASRPVKPQPEAVVKKAVASPLPPPISTQPSERPEPLVESLELPEPSVAETRPLPIRTLDEPEPAQSPAPDELAPAQRPARDVVQLFLEDDPADEESEEMLDLGEQPSLDTKRDDRIPPVAVPRDVPQRTAQSTSADRAAPQHVGPKQRYLSGQRPPETPRSFANRATLNPSAKPSGKMSSVPASPIPHESAATSQRSVANPVTRPALPQSPKYAVSTDAAPDVPRTQNPDTRSVASRPDQTQSPPRTQPQALPQSSAVASKTPFATPVPQQSERPLEPVETLEPVIAATQKPAMRTLEEPTWEVPLPEKRPSRGVVQLFFDDEPADDDSNEAMDVGEPPAPIPQRHEIRHVAAQSQPAERAAQVTKAVLPAEPVADDKALLKQEIMADLTPVSQIDLRKAVELPEIPEMQDQKLREPEDQALAILRHRKPFNIFAVSRDPWLANRDSYPFYHKPLWFEDPNLERCGRGWGPLTTTVSAIHFTANIPILPYRFTAEKPCRCVRTLPDCTVCEKFGCEAYLPPWSLSAAAVQAAATVGFIYIVP